VSVASRDAPCTEQGIRDAIAMGGGPYTFDRNGPTTVVTQAEIVIDNDVILDGEGNLTVDGDYEHRVFSVSEGVTVELTDFTVTGGNAFDDEPAEEWGGGIFNMGTLTLRNSTVSGNVSNNAGGGIHNVGALTMMNSTVSKNLDEGIFNEGEMTLTETTVSGNIGAGVRSNGTLTMTNSTVSGNTNEGIWNEGTLTLTNTLIDDDCFDDDGVIISNGYNIESPGDTCGLDQGTDLVNITEGQLDLGELANNGGPTMTHALGADSVAIDHIPAVDCGVTTDQRGQPRPETGGTMCDVGAFEVQP
jgi:hypothetical protein